MAEIKPEKKDTYLLPNLLPDDPGHLITIQLDHGVLDLDLLRQDLSCVA